MTDAETQCILTGGTCELADLLDALVGPIAEPFDVSPLIGAVSSVMRTAGVDAGLALVPLIKAKVRFVHDHVHATGTPLPAQTVDAMVLTVMA